MQLGGVLSTSQVANSFIGTGLPIAVGGGLLALSAILTLTEEVNKSNSAFKLTFTLEYNYRETKIFVILF